MLVISETDIVFLAGCGYNSAKDDHRMNKIFAGRKYSSKVRAGEVKTKLLDPKLTETMVNFLILEL